MKKYLQADVHSPDEVYDVVVIGGTPAGIAAAVISARLGRTVALVEYHGQLGGMSASGLGKSDIENRGTIAGIFAEFTELVRRHYADRYGENSEEYRKSRNGYYFEPSVAETAFDQLIEDAGVASVLRRHRLESAEKDGDRLRRVSVRDRDSSTLRNIEGRVFIDATYEGDLLAAAGAEYRLGREARDDFDEPHAGVIYYDYERKTILPGTTGEADGRLPAYTYRLCLTSDRKNSRVMTRPPDGYDRTEYLGYIDDLLSGRLDAPAHFKPGRGYYARHFGTMVRALSVAEIPNNKFDVNINPRPLGFPFPEENLDYIEADWQHREQVCARHRQLALGLLYFLQNDPDVPKEHRALANEMHLPLDEFTESESFPWQLYVREGRRLKGRYTFTERDQTVENSDSVWASRHADVIAVSDFPIDSFPVRKRQPGDTVVLEGYLGMLDHLTKPYQVPLRIMIPERVEGLIVPVAASATHVAFSAIRMEPTWMALGQAAGAAAHLCLDRDVPIQRTPVSDLQRLLEDQGQVLDMDEEALQAAAS